MRDITPAIDFEQQPVPRPLTAAAAKLLWLVLPPDPATDEIAEALLGVIAERDAWQELALADARERHSDRLDMVRLRQRIADLTAELRQARQSTRPPS